MHPAIYITKSTSQVYSDYVRTLRPGRKKGQAVGVILSLRKQLTFRDTTTGFPAKLRLRNDCRNSILMTFHCDPFK